MDSSFSNPSPESAPRFVNVMSSGRSLITRCKPRSLSSLVHSNRLLELREKQRTQFRWLDDLNDSRPEKHPPDDFLQPVYLENQCNRPVLVVGSAPLPTSSPFAEVKAVAVALFINDYSQVAPFYGRRLLTVLRRARLNRIGLPYRPETEGTGGIPSAVGCYANFLMVRGLIVLPTFGIPSELSPNGSGTKPSDPSNAPTSPERAVS